MAISKTQLRKIALSFPGANEKPSYGKPAYFVEKKFFTRLRDEDNSIVWIVGSIDERDNLIELDPKTYFITDHYRDYPAVLVRTARITETMLKKMLERRWRAIAPKKMVRELSSPVHGGGASRSGAEGGRGANPPRSRGLHSPRKRGEKGAS